MLDATTLDLERTESWTNDEAREARRLELEEQAQELHAEILDLVERERREKYGMCVRLGRMRDEALWKHFGLYRTFEDYAVKVGAASSHTTATQLAELAKHLESLSGLRALFAAGKVEWTKVRDAALAAIEKPEDEAFWVEEIQKSSGGVVRRKSQEARGLTPTKRTTFDLPLEVDALWDHYRDVVGQRLGRRITKVESMEQLLVAALRGESWKDAPDAPHPEPESEPAEPAPTAAPSPSPPQRIPGPAALLHLHVCRTCSQVEIDGSLGPVPLTLGLTATFRDDAFVQDAEGDVSRTIPTKTRRRVFARDRGTCVVPGCGARGFLESHHEGTRGWKETSHDEERMYLLCVQHHQARHAGWLVSKGTVSTGLRWFDASGNELSGPQVSTWWPEAPASPSSQSSSDVDANTACHTRVWHEPSAVRDARLALRAMGMTLREADALIGVALAQLPAEATASEIAAAALRALS